MSHLHGSHFPWVEAVTHQHAQRVSYSAQHSHCLRVRHAQQAVVVHLQDSHANLQPAVSCCGTARTHLFEHQRSQAVTNH